MERRADETGLVEVTFRLADAADATTAHVVGEFNGWSPIADAMEHEGAGFVARLHLPGGQAYRFRYLLDGTYWRNDHAADGYEANPYGGADSVIDLRDAPPPALKGRAPRPTDAAHLATAPRTELDAATVS